MLNRGGLEEGFLIHLQQIVHFEHLIVSRDVAGVRVNLLYLRVLDPRDASKSLYMLKVHSGEAGQTEGARLQLFEAVPMEVEGVRDHHIFWVILATRTFIL